MLREFSFSEVSQEVMTLSVDVPNIEKLRITSVQTSGITFAALLSVVLASYPQAPRYFVSAFTGYDINFQFLAPVALASLLTVIMVMRRLPNVFVPMVMLLCLLSVLSLTSWNTSSVVYFQEKIQKTWTVIPLFYFAGVVVGRNDINSKQLLQIVFCFCMIIVLTANVIGLDQVSTYVDRASRADSETFGYQLISRIAGLGAAIAFGFALVAKSYNAHSRVIALICGVYLIDTVISSGGRTGLLVFGLGALTMLLLTWPRRTLGLIALVGIVLFTLGVTSFTNETFSSLANDSRLPATLQRLFYYLQSDVDLRDKISRDLLHSFANILFVNNPLFGVGYGNFPVAAGIGDILGKYPHNLYWELLAETGLFGTTAFVIWLLHIFRLQTLSNLFRRENHWLVAGLVIFFGVAMVTSDLVGHRELYFLLGAATTFRRLPKKSKFSTNQKIIVR